MEFAQKGLRTTVLLEDDENPGNQPCVCICKQPPFNCVWGLMGYKQGWMEIRGAVYVHQHLPVFDLCVPEADKTEVCIKYLQSVTGVMREAARGWGSCP